MGLGLGEGGWGEGVAHEAGHIGAVVWQGRVNRPCLVAQGVNVAACRTCVFADSGCYKCACGSFFTVQCVFRSGSFGRTVRFR